MKTYDLVRIADAVRAVAPEARVTDLGRLLKVTPGWNRPKLIEISAD